jgi:hypothetical protein
MKLLFLRKKFLDKLLGRAAYLAGKTPENLSNLALLINNEHDRN